MRKASTHITIDADLLSLARKIGINISQIAEEALRARLQNEVKNLDELKREKEKIKREWEIERKKLEKQLREINERYETRLNTLEVMIKQIREIKEKERQILEIPLVRESIKLIRENPEYLKGRARLIKTKLGIDISEAQLLAWARNPEIKV